MIGVFLALGILWCQWKLGLIKPVDFRANFSAIVLPYVFLILILLLRHLVAAPFKLHQQNVEEHQRTAELKEKAETRVRELLETKPQIRYRFSYENSQAVIHVWNDGPIADVWALLRVVGQTRSAVDNFARWGHTTSYKVKMARGEAHYLALAGLKFVSGEVATKWVIFYATEQTVSMTEAFYSSVVYKQDDGQAPDIHLYVKLFSDPDGDVVLEECHIVLHSQSAERLRD